MARHRDRAAGDVIRQFPQSRRRSLFDLKHLAPSDDITTDSESIYSDEKEIFNALVVPSPSRDSRGYDTGYQMGPIMEEGLAANLAMFIQTSSSSSSPPLTAHHYSGKPERTKADTLWWRHPALSDPLNHPQLPVSRLRETLSTIGAAQTHRKALSLDTVHTNERTSNWPGNPGPAVMPNQPQHPPPERIPTPPGLPSFNTPEAVYCSNQFLAVQGGGRFYAQRNATGADQSPTSYGDAFRRLLGLQASVDTRPGMQSAVGIGRADDGTIVHGRFPYRQSGHNANMARQIHDHPFHQTTLAITESGDRTETEGGGSKDDNVNLQPRRRVRDYVPPSMGRLWPFQDGLLSSTPESSVTQSGITDRAHSFFGIPRTSTDPSRSNGVSSTSRRRAETTMNHIPSHHSQLQSVQAIDDDNDDDQGLVPEGTHSASEILCWLPVQLYLCCLLNPCPFQDRLEEVEGLQTTNSQDTYVTAQSRPSNSTTPSAELREVPNRFGKIEFPHWIGVGLGRVLPVISSRVSGVVQSSR
ncbi:uncharacterized protein N7496_002762 [Penicillium cataractarum]|uniref:Uncharacterized protein n=1 Tax=Penicillium cataractarum TaxID=2100454 RepID=A0A9W9VGV4_9EURO|nr:uncharacterized protein N7496_002762 [Penicillium cataractarum]KAJ5380334.1 hypothetical protein N7496_002762 [Penicillium cataractarum]